MDESANTEEVKIRLGFTAHVADAHVTTKNILITQQASHAHGSELWLAFYILRLISHKARPFDHLRMGCGLPLSAPVSFRPVNLNETKGANYERQRKI